LGSDHLPSLIFYKSVFLFDEIDELTGFYFNCGMQVHIKLYKAEEKAPGTFQQVLFPFFGLVQIGYSGKERHKV